MSRFELWYTDTSGNKLEHLSDVAGFEYVLVYGDIGQASISLPYRRSARRETPIPDRQIHVYRAPTGGALALETVFFNRSWLWQTDQHGMHSVGMGGADPTELLARRIVAEYAGTSEASMTDEADDMMKEIVRRALVDAQHYDGAEADRDIDDLGFSVAADLSAGPSLSYAFAWRNVLSVLQSIQAASKAAGTEVFFTVNGTTPGSYIFTTATGQPGQNRTVGTGTNPLIFGLQFGNLRNPSYTEDYSSEENFIYGGGQGQGTARNIQEAGDSDRMNASQWNRREGFVQASQSTTDNAVREAARDGLARARPRKIFSGEILDTPDTPYGGSGWHVGDKVTTTYLGRQFDALVRSVTVKVNGDGVEDVSARVESTA